jgi:hypothetical protein
VHGCARRRRHADGNITARRIHQLIITTVCCRRCDHDNIMFVCAEDTCARGRARLTLTLTVLLLLSLLARFDACVRRLTHEI